MVIMRNKMIMKYRLEFDLKADLIMTAMNSTTPLSIAVITGVNYIIIRPYTTALIDEGLFTVTNDSLYVASN